MILAGLILEEKRRLEALIPIYDGKIAGCVNDLQIERYTRMKQLAQKDLEKLGPYVALAEREK